MLTTDFRARSAGPRDPEDADVHRELRWYWHDHEFPPALGAPRDRARAPQRPRCSIVTSPSSTRRRELVGHGRDVAVADRARAPTPGCRRWASWSTTGWSTGRRSTPGPRLHAAPSAAAAARGAPPACRPASTCAASGGCSTARPPATTPRGTRARPDTTEVAHPGVDPALFKPARAGDWGWRLLYVGRIDERKGIDAAIDGARRTFRTRLADRSRGRRRPLT